MPTREPRSANDAARARQILLPDDLDTGRGRVVTRSRARCGDLPAGEHSTVSPVIASTASFVTAPRRSNAGRDVEQSTIVDSTPTAHGPSSSTRSTSSARSA